MPPFLPEDVLENIIRHTTDVKTLIQWQFTCRNLRQVLFQTLVENNRFNVTKNFQPGWDKESLIQDLEHKKYLNHIHHLNFSPEFPDEKEQSYILSRTSNYGEIENSLLLAKNKCREIKTLEISNDALSKLEIFWATRFLQESSKYKWNCLENVIVDYHGLEKSRNFYSAYIKMVRDSQSTLKTFLLYYNSAEFTKEDSVQLEWLLQTFKKLEKVEFIAVGRKILFEHDSILNKLPNKLTSLKLVLMESLEGLRLRNEARQRNETRLREEIIRNEARLRNDPRMHDGFSTYNGLRGNTGFYGDNESRLTDPLPAQNDPFFQLAAHSYEDSESSRTNKSSRSYEAAFDARIEALKEKAKKLKLAINPNSAFTRFYASSQNDPLNATQFMECLIPCPLEITSPLYNIQTLDLIIDIVYSYITPKYLVHKFPNLKKLTISGIYALQELVLAYEEIGYDFAVFLAKIPKYDIKSLCIKDKGLDQMMKDFVKEQGEDNVIYHLNLTYSHKQTRGYTFVDIRKNVSYEKSESRDKTVIIYDVHQNQDCASKIDDFLTALGSHLTALHVDFSKASERFSIDEESYMKHVCANCSNLHSLKITKPKMTDNQHQHTMHYNYDLPVMPLPYSMVVENDFGTYLGNIPDLDTGHLYITNDGFDEMMKQIVKTQDDDVIYRMNLTYSYEHTSDYTTVVIRKSISSQQLRNDSKKIITYVVRQSENRISYAGKLLEILGSNSIELHIDLSKSVGIFPFEMEYIYSSCKNVKFLEIKQSEEQDVRSLSYKVVKPILSEAEIALSGTYLGGILDLCIDNLLTNNSGFDLIREFVKEQGSGNTHSLNLTYSHDHSSEYTSVSIRKTLSPGQSRNGSKRAITYDVHQNETHAGNADELFSIICPSLSKLCIDLSTSSDDIFFEEEGLNFIATTCQHLKILELKAASPKSRRTAILRNVTDRDIHEDVEHFEAIRNPGAFHAHDIAMRVREITMFQNTRLRGIHVDAENSIVNENAKQPDLELSKDIIEYLVNIPDFSIEHLHIGEEKYNLFGELVAKNQKNNAIQNLKLDYCDDESKDWNSVTIKKETYRSQSESNRYKSTISYHVSLGKTSCGTRKLLNALGMYFEKIYVYSGTQRWQTVSMFGSTYSTPDNSIQKYVDSVWHDIQTMRKKQTSPTVWPEIELGFNDEGLKSLEQYSEEEKETTQCLNLVYCSGKVSKSIGVYKNPLENNSEMNIITYDIWLHKEGAPDTTKKLLKALGKHLTGSLVITFEGDFSNDYVFSEESYLDNIFYECPSIKSLRIENFPKSSPQEQESRLPMTRIVKKMCEIQRFEIQQSPLSATMTKLKERLDEHTDKEIDVILFDDMLAGVVTEDSDIDNFMF